MVLRKRHAKVSATFYTTLIIDMRGEHTGLAIRYNAPPPALLYHAHVTPLYALHSQDI